MTTVACKLHSVWVTNLLSGVGNDDVTKSSVYGLWDPRYFDGGYDMIASL